MKLFLFLLIIVSFKSYAQHLQFAKKIENNSNDCMVGGVTTDNAGNVYSVGYFGGQADFDPGAGVFEMTAQSIYSDIFVQKLDKTGNFMWAKRFGGISGSIVNNASNIIIDRNGELVIVGTFGGTGDFDPGPDQFILSSNAGSKDIFVIKLDSLGDFIWAKAVGGSYAETSGKFDIDATGNIYMTGSFQGTVDFDPDSTTNFLSASGGSNAYFLKLNVNGNLVWAFNFGGINTDMGIGVTIDSLGNVYNFGTFASPNIDIDPGPDTFYISSTGKIMAYLLKLDTVGNFVWAKQYSGAANNSFVIPTSASSDLAGNIYLLGRFNDITDFDPNIGIYNLSTAGGNDIFIEKLDANGEFIWAKVEGNINDDIAGGIVFRPPDKLLITGSYTGTIDLDPDAGQYNLTSSTNWFLQELDTNATFIWAGSPSVNSGLAYNGALFLGKKKEIYICGSFNGSIDLDFYRGTIFLANSLYRSGFVAKYVDVGIIGNVFQDINTNCVQDNNEVRSKHRIGIIEPGGMVVETNESGIWYVDSLDLGSYTVLFDSSGNWTGSCSGQISFNVLTNDTLVNTGDFGIVNATNCPRPEVSLFAPNLIKCFSNTPIYVSACNLDIGSGAIDNPYVEIQLDSLLVIEGATVPYVLLGNNKIRCEIDTINPGVCQSFIIFVTVGCEAQFGQTLCMEAHLFPIDSCVYVIENSSNSNVDCQFQWDNSDLYIDGFCDNGNIKFILRNDGPGDMQCYSQYRIYLDGVPFFADSISLLSGGRDTLTYYGDGRTWRVELDQHPLHPGSSMSQCTIELCGDFNNWTQNMINVFSVDNSDFYSDFFCQIVKASYDPNIKIGYPIGIGDSGFISKNIPIQYVIEFQNTGTDTAHNIVITDTLNENLNVFSVVPGVSSDIYDFRIYDQRILEWRLNNIMLPDSTINAVASHGFVTFKVNQEKDLTNGTQILNNASIYFDFNDPIITNQTIHVINQEINVFPIGFKSKNTNEKSIYVYPNPTIGDIQIELPRKLVYGNFEVKNVIGQVLFSCRFNNTNHVSIEMPTDAGIYFVTLIDSEGNTSVFKVIKQ